jgi:hypothetical protein
VAVYHSTAAGCSSWRSAARLSMFSPVAEDSMSLSSPRDRWPGPVHRPPRRAAPRLRGHKSLGPPARL